MEFLKENLTENGVMTITLAREEVHNAFNEVLIAELTMVFEKINTNEKIRLVVLTGTGRSFCAGADLNWMKSMKDYTKEENLVDSRKLARMFQVIDSCTKPVLGKINGHALGGGVGLLSVCDYNHTHSKAKFGFTEVCLGLVPAVISPFVINRIGQGFARAYFLSGEKFQSEQALKMNLVNRVSSVESFESEFVETVNLYLQAAPGAAIKAKQLIRDVLATKESELTEMTCEAIAEQRVSSEGQEGMSALLEKRKPSWVAK